MILNYLAKNMYEPLHSGFLEYVDVQFGNVRLYLDIFHHEDKNMFVIFNRDISSRKFT
jgi:hypothetical protein